MRTILLSLAALAAAGTASAATNLVSNGDFETTVGYDGSRGIEFGASYIYPNAVTGWTSADANAFNLLFSPGNATGPNADTRFTAGEGGQFLHVLGSASPTGGNFVALDGDTGIANPVGAFDGAFNGWFEQEISGLNVGRQYRLTFDWAAGQYANRRGDTTEQLFIQFGTDQVSTSTINNPDQGFTGWFNESFTFTAASATQLLRFLSVGTPNGQPPVALLDGISLVETPSPASLALFGLGLAAVGAARSRRR